MQYAESILDLVGQTPLVRIDRLLRGLGPADGLPLVLAKLEMLNPGGSVKDRIGLPMIEAAEQAGLLKPGGTIIEPTSGNTGHGLAIAAARKGYRCIFVMADKQSAEKQALLRAYGADVVLCPTNVRPDRRRAITRWRPGWRGTFPGVQTGPVLEHGEHPRPRTDDGPRDLGADRRSPDPLRGKRRYGRHDLGRGPLPPREEPDLVVVGADPEGSVLSGDTARPYLTEGVGEDFLPGTFDPATVDRWVRVSDRDAFAMARRITREEGILAGESCGTAMIATLDLVRELGATERRQRGDHRDAPAGRRPQLPVEAVQRRVDARERAAPTTGAIVRISELLRDRHRDPEMPDVVIARTTDRVGAAIDLLQLYGISQLPVSEQPEGDDLTGIVGSVSERGLLDRAYRNPSVVERTIGEVMDRPLPTLGVETTLDDAFAILSDGADALLALRGSGPRVVTKLDLLEYIAHRGDADH